MDRGNISDSGDIRVMAKELSLEELARNKRRSIAQMARKRQVEQQAREKAAKKGVATEVRVRDDLERPEIVVNGVSFIPHPDIGLPGRREDLGKGLFYKTDYIEATLRIKRGLWPEFSTWRQILQDDLWAMFYFVVKPFSDEVGKRLANSPFAVGYAREIEDGPLDFTLDLVAREHFKTTLITIAETIQYVVNNPENSTAIFSHVRPQAKKFLSTIKDIFQRETFLQACFADVIWGNCEKDAPIWSMDEGLVLRRKTTRPQPTVGAYGLIEGMPIGMHFERMIFDDISTEDTAESFDQMEKIKLKFDSAQNLGKENGHHRVIGTYYHHEDPLVYVKNKTTPEGNKKYHVRFKPATEDGTAMGKPVLISQRRLDDLKLTRTFQCQQLLDPSPSADQRLNPDFLRRIEKEFIPRGIYKFMLIDQAGDRESNLRTSKEDPWAMGVFGVRPAVDEIGMSDVYLLDLWIQPAGESEAIEEAVRMYIRAGIVQRLGVEKVGISTTHLHIANALKAQGRYVRFPADNDRRSTGVLLRPAGRNKRKFIESAMAWPLNNSKWYYSSDVPVPYLDRLKMEMSNFPLWHDDGLNICAYLYDILREYHFEPTEHKVRTVSSIMEAQPLAAGW